MQETEKHSPRVDQQLKHEDHSLTHGAGVEARAQDSRTEQDTEGLPNPADRPDLRDVPGTAMTTGDVDARARLATAISAAKFPADAGALVSEAERAFAGDDVVDRLRSLPGGRDYENVEAVWEALGGANEGPHNT